MKMIVLSKWFTQDWDSSLYPCNPSLDDELRRLFVNHGIYEHYEPPQTTDDIMTEFRANGRDYEYCPDTEDNINSTYCVRRKKNKKPLPLECVFCKNNGEPAYFYKGHILKNEYGVIVCPVLRAYQCPICGRRGDKAHTIKYCPKNVNPNLVPIINTLKSMRNSTGKLRK